MDDRSTQQNERAFTGWAYIRRAEDVPGCWVAHCLDFNVMSIGDSPQHALDMVREAVGLAVADDLNRGLDPTARRAPEDEWQPLLRLFAKHTKVPVNRMNERADYTEFAAPVTVVLVRVATSDGMAPSDLDPHSDDMAHATAA